MKKSLLVLALLCLASQAHAKSTKPSIPGAIASGLGAVVGTVVYAPFKVATAFTGLAVGMVLLPFTDSRSFIDAATCGDYTLSDEMLRGEQKLCFWYGPTCGPY